MGKGIAMKDYRKAETKVDTKDAKRVRTEARGYTPARGKAHGASETGSSARLGGSGSFGNKSRHHRYGGFRGTALVVLLTFSMVFASVLGAFADDLTNTVPSEEAPGGTFYSDTINTGLGTNGPNPSGATYKGYGPDYGPYEISGVYQSQSTASPTSFAAGLPLGTIFIDQSKISQTGGVTKVVATNPQLTAGLVPIEGTNKMGYDGTQPGAILMVPGKINELNGDLFKVTFEDAAILPNGDRAHLVITYSNARIVIDERYMALPDGSTYYEVKRCADEKNTNPAPTPMTRVTGDTYDNYPVYKGSNGLLYYLKSGKYYRIFEISPVESQPVNPSATTEKFTYNGKQYTVYTEGGKRYIKPDNERYYHGAVSLAQGNAISYGGTDYTDMSETYGDAAVAIVNETAGGFGETYTRQNKGTDPAKPNSNIYPTTGLTMDATYQIVNKDGTPAAGTFVFAVCGINLDRDPDAGTGTNTAKPLWYVGAEKFNDGTKEYQVFTEGSTGTKKYINKGTATNPNWYELASDGTVSPTPAVPQPSGTMVPVVSEAGKDHSFFSEAMEIAGGQKSEYVYVRPNTSQEDNPDKITGVKGQYFYPNVSLHNGNIKFIGNQVDANLSGVSGGLGGNDNSYNAGFVTLADAATGFKVTATGHGNSGAGMNSLVFNSKQIWYRYTSSTGRHGSIQTTSEGNYKGTLNDGGDILEPEGYFEDGSATHDKKATHVVAEGKDVYYTMTPDTGYKLKTLKIGKNFDANGVPTEYEEVKFNEKSVNTMKKGDQLEVATADGKKQGLLKYNGDGTYVFKFEYAEGNEAIHVEWEPVTADILVSKVWDDEDDKDGMREDAYERRKFPFFRLEYSINGGRTWNPVNNNTIGGTTAQPSTTISPEQVPSGKDEESGSPTQGTYLDGTYTINKGTTGTYGSDPAATQPAAAQLTQITETCDGLPVFENQKTFKKYVLKDDGYHEVTSVDHPYTWQNLPAYKYDASGDADRMISYRIVEYHVSDADPTKFVDNEAIKDYEPAEYYDAQAFELTSETSKSVEGWQIYEDSSSGKTYVKRGDELYYEVDSIGAISDTPADPQPDEGRLVAQTSIEYRTADKGIAYQMADVRNYHEPKYVYVEVGKEWNDDGIKDVTTGDDVNEYARKNLKFVLKGRTTAGSVDINGDAEGQDLATIIKENETADRTAAEASKKIDGYQIFEKENDSNEKYAWVKGHDDYEDGYYKIDNDAIDYADAAAPYSGLTDLVAVGAFKKDEKNFGMRFEDLPTHDGGKPITYTVTEYFEDTSTTPSTWIEAGDRELAWITTGGELKEVRIIDGNTSKVVGYTSDFINTPTIEDVYETLPLTILKQDVVTENPLETAEFTIYRKSTGSKAFDKNDLYEVEGQTIYYNQNDAVEYVLRKKAGQPAGDEKLYYHTFKEDPQNPGEYIYTYVTSQPDASELTVKKQMVESNVITTKINGMNTFNILLPGNYEVKETKAPTGYTADPSSYTFSVDRNLKKITLESYDDDHETKWWKKLYDLLFRDGQPDNADGRWIPATDKKGGTLKVNDQPIDANILVRKYWEDNDDQDDVRPEDGDANMPKVILEWTTAAHTATGLPVYTDAKGKVKYVHNQSDNKYYKVTKEDEYGEYVTSAAQPQPDADKLTEVADTTCQGRKVYEDEDDKWYVYVDEKYHELEKDTDNNYLVDTQGSVESDPAAKQPKESELRLVMDEGAGWQTTKLYNETSKAYDKDAEAPVNYADGPVLTHQHDAYTWNDVPAYRDGKPVVYRVSEASPLLDDGTYRLKSSHTSDTKEKVFTLINNSGENVSTHNQTVDVTNRHETRIINIDAYKVWNDDDPTKRKESTLTLWKEVNGARSIVSKTEGGHTTDDTGTVPTTDQTDPVKTWSDLPVFERGYPITYTIEETTIDGYKTVYELDYTKENGTSEGEEIHIKSDTVDAEDVKRTYYQGATDKKIGDETVYTDGTNEYVKRGDDYYEVTGESIADSPAEPQPDEDDLEVAKNDDSDIPSGVDKEPGDESTTASFTIENEETIDIPIKKTWIDGANANVTFQLWRTTTKEEDLTSSVLGDVKEYELTSNPDTKISVAQYRALSDADKALYTPVKRIICYQHNETGNYISVQDYDELPTSEKSKYTAVEGSEWSPYDPADPSKTVDGWERADDIEHEFLSRDFENQHTPGYSVEETFKNLPRQKIETAEGKTIYKEKTGTNPKKYVLMEDPEATGQDVGKQFYFTFTVDEETGEYTYTKADPQPNRDDLQVSYLAYMYRVFEVPKLVRYTADQTSDFNITNYNLHASNGFANVEVVKELEGRKWDVNGKDEFYFELEPISAEDKTNPSHRISDDDIPLPSRMVTNRQVFKDANDKRYVIDGDDLYREVDSNDKVADKPANPQPKADNLTQDGTINASINYPIDTSKAKAVGAIGRAVDFKSIEFSDESVVPRGNTVEFNYKVREVYDMLGTSIDDATDHTGKRNGITYAGKVVGGNFVPEEHDLKIVVKNDDSGKMTTEIYWDGNTQAGAVPVYTNRYSSESEAKAWIEKEIKTREWEEYDNSAKTGDAFRYEVLAISGSQLNVPGADHSGTDDSYPSKPLISNESGNPQEDIQQESDNEYAFGLTGNKYTGDMLNSNGEGYFIYAIREMDEVHWSDGQLIGGPNFEHYKVDGLEYDDEFIYAKVKVNDNWDGTLRFEVKYYSDAACRTEITDYQVWIEDKFTGGTVDAAAADPQPTASNLIETKEILEGMTVYYDKSNKKRYVKKEVDGEEYCYEVVHGTEGKRLMSQAEIKAMEDEHMTQDQKDANGYRQVNVAHFINRETVDIPITKEWVGGPAVEDVNLHLKRHLFELKDEEHLDSTAESTEEYLTGDDFVKSAENRWTDTEKPFWQPVGLTHIVERGAFLDENGEPKYDDDEKTISSQTYGDLKDDDGKTLEKEDYIEGFNKDLPKYVKVDGVIYRAVYKLEEDDTSDAYKRSYKRVEESETPGGDPVVKKDAKIYINSGTLVVTNKVTATNTANIAAVKQLLGRGWMNTDDIKDDFEFEIEALGKGKYDKDTGKFVEVDTSAEAKAAVPMPGHYKNKNDDDDVISIEAYNALTDEQKANYEYVSNNKEAHAKEDDTTVDLNGNLERLARFDSIEYKVTDLTYNPSDKHMQGDFFYVIREKIPDDATIEVTEGDTTRTVTYAEATAAQKAAGGFKKNGITYDGTEHIVHVKVRENRTGKLQTQISYDENPKYDSEDYKADITTGTQFTPVFTNKYTSEVDVEVKGNKYIMGRDWAEGDNFDFVMIPMAGAPFMDANRSDFPANDTNTDAEREAALENPDDGIAIHNKDGEHVMRLFVDKTKEVQEFSFPKLKVKSEDLHKVTDAESQADPEQGAVDKRIKDKDGNVLPLGVTYGQFMYAIAETAEFDKLNAGSVEDLIKDPDTEYARVTVYDPGNGVLEYRVDIFEDRYGNIPRYKPDPETGEETKIPADAVTFVNKLDRNLTVIKAWDGTSTEDVTLKLQWSVLGDSSWHDVESTEWFPNIDGTKIIRKNATGDELKAKWPKLPTYANISDYDDMSGESGDNKELNDMWIYYRVIELPEPAQAAVYYNEVAYRENDTPSTKITIEGEEKNKYRDEPYHTGPEKDEHDKYLKPEDRVHTLHVTNFPTDITEEASFGVVKQYIGKNWEDEEFEFIAEPVKSKLGGATSYINNGTYYKKGPKPDEMDQATYDAAADIIYQKEYDELQDADIKDLYSSKQNRMPDGDRFKDSDNSATAKKDSEDPNKDKVSVNEYAANFKPLTIKRSDLAFNSETGKMEGEFIYKITEKHPTNAAETAEYVEDKEGNKFYYYVADDGKGNNIKYTTEEHFVTIKAVDEGSGNLNISINYDERNSGEFVPVYTNYAQLTTPIEGSKTWIGGSAADHKNGRVNIEGNEITDAEDSLGLTLKRKTDKEGARVETLDEDDSKRELVIVWAQKVDTITSYKLKEGQGDEDDPTTLSVDEYESLDETDKAKYEPETSKTWVKNETGDGVFTIKAKKVTGSGESATTTYEDPFLNVTDKDGYEYTYFIEETEKPDGYEDSYKDLNVTNSTAEDVTGTVQLKVDKVLTGRRFQRGDKYTYMVTGESKYKGVGVQVTRQNNVIDALKNGISNFVDKLFGSGEIEPDADDNTGNIPLPKDKTKEIAPSSGTKESVDFGTIEYTRGDLAKRTIKFKDATDAQKKSARYWTVKTTTGEGEETVTTSTTYDLTNGKDKSAWDALKEDVKKEATTTVYENVFTYKVMENPMDSDAGDTKPVENDTSIKTIVVYALLDQMNNKILVSSELFTDESESPAVEYFATGQDATSKTVSLQPVTFVNVYTSAGEYDSSATKTLDNRPLERDQFDFRWERVEEEVDPEATEEWAIPEAPLATEDPQAGLWDKKDDDKGQDVVKDADAANKGTDDLYGPIDFALLKFTNENLKKKVKYTGGLSDDIKNKVAAWEWKDGDNKEFVYGYIPDDAEAEVGAITVDGTANEEALKYKDATDAQRRAGKSDSLESVWKLDGKTYIAATTENSSILTDAVADDYDVVGYYYEDSREYTYKLYEVIPDAATATSGDFEGSTYADAKAIATAPTATPDQRLAFESVEGWTLNGYTYDGVIRTVKVTIKDKGDSEDEDEDGPKDGNIVITEIVVEKPDGTQEKKLTEKNITDPLTNFDNTYEAEGLVELSIKKKLEGAESATTEPQKATFTLANVTEDAPMPQTAEKELVMDPDAANFENGAWTVKFDDLEFTHEHFMEGSNYIATRVKGSDGKGYYERTFVYTVTETGMTAAVNNGVTSDTNSKITVAITVREDDEGNITVVAVNGLDSDAIGEDDRVDFSVDRDKATTEGVAHSKVLAGTFTNKYQASGTATLKATKKLHGFDADGSAKELQEGQFEFVLKDNAIQTTGDNKVIHGVTNTVDAQDATKGTVTFRTLTYNVEDLTKKSTPSGDATVNEYGVAKGKAFDIFTYTIKEVVPESDMIADGYIYGKSKVSATAVTEKTVSVLVWDMGDGNLGVKYNKEGDEAPDNFQDTLADDDVTINNLYVGERTFVGTKIWVDGGQPHNNSDELAQLLTLYKTTTKPENWTDETQFNAVQLSDYHIDWTKVTSADDTFTISGLPFDDGEGNRLYYKVVETAPQGYTANHSNKGTGIPAPDTYTDGIASGGTITNVAKVGDVTISKKFVDKDGKVIPKASLPKDFKIDVEYTTIVEEDGVKKSIEKPETLTIGDDQTADADGFYKWTVEDVAYNTKVTAEEEGFEYASGDAKGYTYVETETTVKGKSGSKEIHSEESPTYAETVMPLNVAVNEPDRADDNECSITFVNKYERDRGSLDPVKVWDDESNRDDMRPDSVTFKITAKAGDPEEPVDVFDDGEGGKTSSIEVEFTKDNNGTDDEWTKISATESTIDGLPLATDAGDQITYYIEEEDVPTSYNCTESSKTTVLTKDDTAQVKITNSYTPKSGQFAPTKEWKGDDNDALNMRRDTHLYLYKQVADSAGTYGDKMLVSVKDYALVKKDSETIDITDWGTSLPAYENGYPIRYTVAEETVPGYTTTYEYKRGSETRNWAEIVLTQNQETGAVTVTPDSIKVINSFDPEFNELTIEKKWVDNDDREGYRPDEITVTVSAELADKTAALVFDDGGTKKSTKTYTLKASEDWKKTIAASANEFPMKWNGEQVYYFVTEQADFENSDKYNAKRNNKAIIERTDQGEFTLTNVHEIETGCVEAEKVWEDADNQDGKRSAVTFKLYADGQPAKYVDGSAVPDKTISADISTPQSAAWHDLPVYKTDGTGAKVTYTVVESGAASGYTTTYSPAAGVQLAKDGDVKKITVTNSYTPETVDVEATKVWAGETDATGTKFRGNNKVKLHLYGKADGKIVFDAGEKTVNDSLTVDKNGTCTPVEWNDQPKYHEGDELTWVVEEEPIPGYTCAITGDAEDGFTVTNTFVPMTVVKATKVWKDENNRDGKRADVKVKLVPFVDGTKKENALDDSFTLEKTIPVNANAADGADAGTVTWTDLPIETSDHKAITYVVSETSKPRDYTSKVLATDKAGEYKIENSYTPETIDVEVEKTWDDSSNALGMRPDHIEITLKADGTTVETVLVTGSGNKWSHEFTDLPKNKADGSDAITYTVEETALAGYTTTYDPEDKSVSGDDGKVKITNSIKKGVVYVRKAWNDNNDHDGKRPTAREFAGKVHLYADGKELNVTPTTDASGNTWTLTYDDLAAYNTKGELITYMVVEDSIADYTQTGTITPSGSMDASKAKPDLTLSLANKHDSSTDITGTKVWRDDDRKHNNQTEVELTVMRQADGGDPEEVDDAHIDWDGDNYTVTGLPVFDEDGNKYTYWVVETAIDEYEDPVYDNSKSTGTTDAQKAETDIAYNGGKIINSALTSITITKKWDDAKYFEGEAAESDVTNEYVRPVVTFTVTATATTEDAIAALVAARFTQDSTDKTKYTRTVELSGATSASEMTWTEVLNNLPMYDQDGKKIKYVATEGTTPEGFIKDEGEEDTEVSNKPKEDETVNPIDLTIKKEDGATDTHEGLNGAEFTIYLSNGETPASAGSSGAVESNNVTTSGSENDAGKAVVTFQKPGTYVIKETKAPKGYALSEKSFTVQVDKKLKSITLKEEDDPSQSFWEWLHDLFFNDEGSSSSMSGDTTQGFTLTVNDDPIRAEVLVDKVWDDEDDQDGLRGNASAMPEVKLQYKIGSADWADATDTILGGQGLKKPVPEEDGKVSGGKNYTWNELPAYIDGEEVTYRVVEEGKISEYEEPIYSKESFTLANSAGTKADNAEVSVTNTYEPATAKVQVSKKWADNNNLDELRVDELTFRLISDGDFENSKDLEIDTDVDDGDEAIKTPDDAIWLDLPVYKDGKKIRYTLTETTKIDGYTVEYAGTDAEKKNVKFELDPDSDNPYLVTVTNKHTPDAVRIWVKKEWLDNNDQDGMRTEVEIKLTKADDSEGHYDGKDKAGETVKNLKLNSSNNYRGKFDNLKAVDEDGNIITYTVEEVAVPEGYDDNPDLSGSGTHADPFVITNSRDTDTVKVTATKEWVGDEEFSDETRKDVTLHLIGRKGDGIAWDGGSKTIELAGGEPAEWTGLPRNIDGTELVWEVYEDAVPGYVMSVSGSGSPDKDGNVEFAVTNTYVGAVAEVTATKQWKDDNNRDGIRDDVYFQLYRTVGYDGSEEAIGEPEKVVKSDVADGEDAGSVTWEGLPETLEGEGQTIYTEVTPGIDDIPAEMGWYEENADEESDEEYVETSDTEIAEGKTYYEKTDTTTERAVIYTVKEVDAEGNVSAPSGYESIVTQTSAGEFIVTNIHTPYTTELSVQKIWYDGNDNAGLRPDHLKIRLKDGDETVREVVLTDKDEGDGWNSGIYTFTGLIKNENGEPIDYKVVELDSDEDTELDGSDGHNETSYGYTVSIQDEGRGSVENPVVITNSYEGGGESSLTVTKKWEGDAKHKYTRGDVKLHLIKVIEGARSVVEDKDKIIKFDPKNPDKAMTAEWTGLPTMEKGKSVVYTVEEFDVPAGYRASVGNAERDDDNNYTVTVTNTYSETPVFGEDVIFIDPLNPAGKMALKSTTYDTHAEAQTAANNKTGAPANPKHSGYKFTGWAVNYDTNGNFVLVATYSQKPVKENTTSYIDPQSGEPLLVSEVTDNPDSVKPPKDPKHPNLVFIGWKKVTDASGNTIYVAEYGCECSNGSPNPKSVDKSRVNTGDDNMLYVWIWILLLSAVSFVLTAMMRNRSFSRTDGYKPRH